MNASRKHVKIIRWSSNEWDNVVARAAELFVKGVASNETEALRHANKQMPESRRRSGELYPSSYPDWGRRWPGAVDHARSLRQHANVVEPTPVVSATDVVQHEDQPLEVNDVQPAWEPVESHSAVDVLARALGEVIGQLVLDALQSAKMQGALQEKLRPILPTYVPRVAPSPAPAAKKRVLIVGLLGSQATTISNEFGSAFDLRFLTQEDASARITAHAKSADVTYGLVSYMGHHVEKSIKDGIADTRQYRRINGTVGDLRRALTGLAAEGKAGA